MLRVFAREKETTVINELQEHRGPRSVRDKGNWISRAHISFLIIDSFLGQSLKTERARDGWIARIIPFIGSREERCFPLRDKLRASVLVTVIFSGDSLLEMSSNNAGEFRIPADLLTHRASPLIFDRSIGRSFVDQTGVGETRPRGAPLPNRAPIIVFFATVVRHKSPWACGSFVNNNASARMSSPFVRIKSSYMDTAI